MRLCSNPSFRVADDLGLVSFKLAGCFCKPRPLFNLVAAAFRDLVRGPFELFFVGSKSIEIVVLDLKDFICPCSHRFLVVGECFLELCPIVGDGLSSLGSNAVVFCDGDPLPIASLDNSSCQERRSAQRDFITRFESSLSFSPDIEVSACAGSMLVGSVECGSFLDAGEGDGDLTALHLTAPCSPCSGSLLVGSIECGDVDGVAVEVVERGLGDLITPSLSEKEVMLTISSICFYQIEEMHTFGYILVFAVTGVLTIMNVMWFGKILKGLRKQLAKR